MTTELDTFYELVKEIGTAMMTTRRPDGHLESRAMTNQKRAAGAGLWFVTAEGSGKLRSLEADPHINLSYYKDRNARMDLGVRPRDDLTRSAEDPRAVRARLDIGLRDEGDARHGTADESALGAHRRRPDSRRRSSEHGSTAIWATTV